jgi:hypothetical protein
MRSVAALITRFDKAARGMTEITFPAGKNVKRIVLSGFDPSTDNGGNIGGDTPGVFAFNSNGPSAVASSAR